MQQDSVPYADGCWTIVSTDKNAQLNIME